MSKSQTELYREFEARERTYAAEATLAHVRDMHLRAAGTWAGLAEKLEHLPLHPVNKI